MDGKQPQHQNWFHFMPSFFAKTMPNMPQHPTGGERADVTMHPTGGERAYVTMHPLGASTDVPMGEVDRTLSLMPPDDEKEFFKARVPKKLAGDHVDVDIKLGSEGLTVGLGTDGKTKKVYTMSDITDEKYRFVKSENNPKITYENDHPEQVISFSLFRK